MRRKRNDKKVDLGQKTDKKAVFSRKTDKKTEKLPKNAAPRPKKQKPARVPTRFAFSKPKIELEIDGFNQPRFLSELVRAGIKTKKVRKITARKMRIIIEEKYAVNCFAICRRMCYNYTEVERFGAKYAGSAALRRIGAIIAAVAVAAAGYAFSGRLNRVEITGTDEARKAAITAYLADNGVKPSCRTDSVSASAVRELVLGFDGVAECTASLTGTVLTVTVRDRDVPAGKPDRKSAVTSRYDAIVTKVVALGGTAKVKSGQTVKAGQTLIEGAIYRTDGELLRETDAIGTVYGRVAETKKFLVTENSAFVRRTGRKVRVTELGFFGAAIGGKAPEGTFEVTETVSRLMGFITVRSRLYEEIERVTVTSGVDELTERCVAAALEGYFGSGEITIKTHVSDLGGGAYEITVYTENERIIS